MTRKAIIDVLRTVAALAEVDDWQPEHFDELAAAAVVARGEVGRFDRNEQRQAERAARSKADAQARVAKIINRGYSPDPPELREAKKVVHARSGGMCEAHTPVCDVRAQHVHHITRRKAKGCHAPELLLHVCHCCHDWIHANPTEAEEHGWLRRSGALPPVQNTKGR